jgi:DNA (cytosine-5)-methyltransferase 1
LGNGCNLHPDQNRIISTREGARLQSFRDEYIFYGSKTSHYKQIGNAVPPLLARAIAESVKEHLDNHCFIDLFAGAGGMSEGFVMEGFKLMAANEFVTNYFETFKKNHIQFDTGNNLILGDITSSEIKEQLYSSLNSEKIGIIIGGPPCQGFSHAGWRDPKDNRNQLFKEFVHIVEELRPEIFIMENVPGIATMRKGDALKEIISSFVEIGYNVNSVFKLNAEDYGVPQKRKRIIIIGSLKKIHFKQPRQLFSYSKPDLPDPINVKEAIGGLPELKTGEGAQEMMCEYEGVSSYEKLLMGEIDFNTFYTNCFKREKRKLPSGLTLF